MNTFNRLEEIIKNEHNIVCENISVKTLIAEELGLDSLDMYEMLISIEDEFHISIAEDKFDEINTVGDLVCLIEESYPNKEVLAE